MGKTSLLSLKLGVSLRDFLAAAGSALLGAAAFPPVCLWPCTLISIVLFLSIIHDRQTSEARRLGLVYGLFYGLGTMYWMFGIFGALAVSLIALMAGYFGILATAIGLTRGHRPLARAALAALFAVAVEWLRGDAWYLRFPWYTAPHALAASPAWVSLARWLGVYGLSYVAWLIAAGGVFWRPWAWAAFLLLPAGTFFLPAIDPPSHRALLIQTEEVPIENLIAKIGDERFDLAVLPEYAYFVSPAKALSNRNGPAALAGKIEAPVVFGAVEGEYGEPVFDNVAAVISATGELLGTFPKQRPVPLFRDGVPGGRRPVFSVEQGVLGVAICYDFDAPEIAASLVNQGATVLVAPTFDAMSWGRAQHVHHELLLRLRALENDRWIVRAASSGRSEAIDPHGVPSADGIEIGKVGTVAVGYGHRHTTPWGGRMHILGPLAAAVTAGLGLARVATSIRRRGMRDEAQSQE